LGSSFMVKPYYDSPRVLMASADQSVISQTAQMSLDLLRDDIRTVLYPGQSLQGLIGFNQSRGMMEMSLETTVLAKAYAGSVVSSVSTVFDLARQQNIPLVFIGMQNLDDLNALKISDQARARITESIQQQPQLIAVVPRQAVTISTGLSVTGQPQVGWLLIDPYNGHTVDVMENGQHQAIVEYAFILNNNLNKTGDAIIGFLHGFTVYSFAFVAYFLQGLPFDTISVKDAWNSASKKALTYANQVADDIAKAAGTTVKYVPNIEAVKSHIDAYLDGVGASFTLKISVPAIPEWASKIGINNSWSSPPLKIIEVPMGFKNGALAAQAMLGQMTDPPLPGMLYAPLDVAHPAVARAVF
jgi:hypothetical protein